MWVFLRIALDTESMFNPIYDNKQFYVIYFVSVATLFTLQWI